MGFISSFLGLFGRKSLFAKQITIDELEGQLALLLDGKTEFDCIGITSNGVDCIYFVREGTKIQIEFEAMIAEQLPYIELLQEFADQNGIQTNETTYGNQPEYDSNNPAPVIKLNVNADIKKAAEIGRQIESVIFKTNRRTKYEVVP